MVNGRVTRWGNSLGVRLPKKKAVVEGIEEGDEVIVVKCGLTAGELARRFPLKRVRKSTQKMKDEARRGWGG